MSGRVVLESNLFRKDASTNASFQYHNHILVGTRLYFVIRQSKPRSGSQLSRVQKFVNSASGGDDFRLILVQGKRKGRLSGIKLFQHSEITVGKHTPKAPTPFLINVSGVDQEIGCSLDLAAHRKGKMALVDWPMKAREHSLPETRDGEAARASRLMKGDLKQGTIFIDLSSIGIVLVENMQSVGYAKRGSATGMRL